MAELEALHLKYAGSFGDTVNKAEFAKAIADLGIPVDQNAALDSMFAVLDRSLLYSL